MALLICSRASEGLSSVVMHHTPDPGECRCSLPRHHRLLTNSDGFPRTYVYFHKPTLWLIAFAPECFADCLGTDCVSRPTLSENLDSMPESWRQLEGATSCRIFLPTTPIADFDFADRLQLPNQRTKLLTPSVASAGVQGLVNLVRTLILSGSGFSWLNFRGLRNRMCPRVCTSPGVTGPVAVGFPTRPRDRVWR
jgi:hypothetical protein